MRYRATLAYDGTAYQGFQRQAKDAPTIQGAVEQAVASVTGQSVTVLGAGRTDAGVHALGQVITFSVEWRHDETALLRALNATLPDDIALQDLTPAPPRFHPRFDARSRLYRYQVLVAGQRQPLWRDRAWHLRDEPDGQAMQAAAALLVGTHDFAAFGNPPQGENTVRTVFQSGWTQQTEYNERLWTYRIEANAFLHHMVRRIVGMLVEVGRSRLTVADFETIFRRADLNLVKHIAPPQGLYLEAVRY